MDLHLQYITNDKGVPQAVVIPLTEWDLFQTEYNKLKKKLAKSYFDVLENLIITIGIKIR